MINSLNLSTLDTSSEQSNAAKSDRPILWVSKDDLTDAEAVLSTHFQVLTPENPVQSSLYQIIALQSERDIRRLIPQIQAQDPEGDIKVYQLEASIACFLAFHGQPFAGLMMGSIPPEQWLKSRADQPLDLQDALAIARDILVAKKSQTQANIELEDLRRRCNVSSFDWNRYIKDLEAEIHAAVDGKVLDSKERLRLDVKALLKETDPINYEVARADIQSRYRLNHKALERIIRSLDQRTKLAQLKSIGMDELFDLPQTGVEYVIPGMLPVGDTVLLVADPKAGKSLLAYDAAFAVATGEDSFLGEQVKQGKVLIVQCDEPIRTARGRLLRRGFLREDAPNVRFISDFNISQLQFLEAELESFRPTLVIIDCLKKIYVGRAVSENSAEFADGIYELKELITRYNAAGILIHHTNKNQEAVGVGRVRGSSAIAGAVWGIWQLDHILKPDPNNKKRMIVDPKEATRILSITARDTEGQRLRVELDPERNHWLNLGEEGVEASEVNDRKTNEDKILALLKPIAPTGLEASEINKHLHLGRGIYCYLNRLLAKGVISSRPSAKDKRRVVYFYPSASVDPLPPPPNDKFAINYAESFNEQELKDDRKTDRKLIAKNSSETVLDTSEAVLDTSELELVISSEVDRKNRSQGGERGSTEVAINSVDNQEKWIEAVHPKSKQWNAALYLGRVKKDYKVRFMGESAIIVQAKNVRFDC